MKIILFLEKLSHFLNELFLIFLFLKTEIVNLKLSILFQKTIGYKMKKKVFKKLTFKFEKSLMFKMSNK